jgi:Fe(3+) dicitrate transport protein
MKHFLLYLLFLLMGVSVNAQMLRGRVVTAKEQPAHNVTIRFKSSVHGATIERTTDSLGRFLFKTEAPGELQLWAHGNMIWNTMFQKFPKKEMVIKLLDDDTQFRMRAVWIKSNALLMSRNLWSVEGFGIYAARKTEVIYLDEAAANLATNNARQIYGRVAGLNIWESDGAGLQLGIGGRGLSPNRTSNFNTRQDGYDMAADALGYPESYYTPPTEALDRIELVRGAASLQYGTQFGGMVNFRMQQAPDSGLRIKTRFTAGSFGFLGFYGSMAWRKGQNDGFAFVQHKEGNGWRSNSRFNAQTAYLQSGWRSKNGKSYHKLAFTHMQYLAQQPGGLTDRQFEENPQQSNRPRNWFSIDWNLGAHEWEYHFNNNSKINSKTFGLYASRAALGNLERINVADAVTGNRTLIDGFYQNVGHETRLLHKMGRDHWLLGIRLYQGVTTARQGDGSASADPDFKLLHPDNPENSDYRFPNQNAAIFTEYLQHFGRSWKVTAGIRGEFIKTQAIGHYRNRVFDFAGNLIADRRVDERDTRVRDFVIGGIGVSYTQSKMGEWYANLNQNYRAINFSDLRVVNPNFKVDSTLKDERGYTADIGYRGRPLPWLRIDGSLFLLYYQNKIGQVLKADQAPLFIDYRLRTNVAAARSMGIEALIEAQLFKSKEWGHLQAYGNFAFTHARYVSSDEPGISGNHIELVPPVIIRTGLQHQWKSLKVSAQYSWVASQFSDATNAIRTSTAVEGIIPSYGVADVSASYLLGDWKIEFSVNNVLNERYFTRRADGYPGPGIIPSDGRAFYMTLEFRF